MIPRLAAGLLSCALALGLLVVSPASADTAPVSISDVGSSCNSVGQVRLSATVANQDSAPIHVSIAANSIGKAAFGITIPAGSSGQVTLETGRIQVPAGELQLHIAPSRSGATAADQTFSYAALACDGPVFGVTFTPHSGVAGTTVSFSGVGCLAAASQPDVLFTIQTYSKRFDEFTAEVESNADGTFSGTYQAPPEVLHDEGEQAGPTYTVSAYCTGTDVTLDKVGDFTYARQTNTSSSTSTTTSTTTPTSTTAPTTSTTATTSTTSTTGPAATTNTATADVGGQVAVSGSGWQPGSKVDLELHSTPVHLGTATVGSDGTFSTRVTIPPITAGAHKIVVTGTDAEGKPASSAVSLTVTAEGALPRTGQDLRAQLLFALVAVGAGLILVAASRGSRTERRNVG